MFLTQSVREQSIPFVPTMNVPNERLLSAIKEVEDIENGKIKAKRYKTFEDALKAGLVCASGFDSSEVGKYKMTVVFGGEYFVVEYSVTATGEGNS